MKAIKSLLIIFITTLFFLSANSQIQYHVIIGGTNEEVSSNILTTKDNGCILTCKTKSYGQGDSDILVTKLDELGQIQWSRSFGTSNRDLPRNIIEDSQNGYIIAGWKKTDQVTYYDDWYIIKIDSLGNLIWEKFAGSYEDDELQYITRFENNYFLSGNTRSFGQGISDIYIARMDESGNFLWFKTIGGFNSDHNRVIKVTSDNNLIIASYTNSFGSGNFDFILSKLDFDGIHLWSKTYGGYSDDYIRDIVETSDNGYLVLGYTNSFGAGSYDILLIKTDNSGNLIWSSTYGGYNDDKAYQIKKTDDSGYIISGFSNSFGAGGYDVYLFKVNEAGNLIWAKSFGGENDEYDAFVDIANDGGFIINSATESFGSSDADMLIIKTDESGNSCCGDDVNYTIISAANITEILVNPTIGTGSGFPQHNTNNLNIHPDFRILCFEPVNIFGKDTVCFGEQGVLYSILPNIAGNFNWTVPEDATIVSGQGDTSIIVDFGQTSGYIYISLIDGCNPDNLDSLYVNVLSLTSIDIGNDTTICSGDSIILNAGSGYETYLWQDGSSDSIFIAGNTGYYWVEVTDTNGCIAADTILLTVIPSQNVFLGNDTTICDGSFLTLNPGTGYDYYLWQDGTTDSIYIVTQSGIYWIEVSNICGISSDTINVTFAPAFYINLGNDTSFCYGNSVILYPGSGFVNYLWQNGSSDSIFIASSTGYYWVAVTDTNGCTAIDSVYITVFMDYEISIGDDTSTICEGDYLFLDPGPGFESYLWQDGSSYQTFIADTAGIYWVEVTDTNSCAARDSILLVVRKIPENFLGNDTVICPGYIITLNAGEGFVQYLWQDGSSDSVFIADSVGIYWVYVEDDIGCSGSDTVVLLPFSPPSLNLPNEVFICKGDSIVFNAGSGYLFYNWQNGSNDSVFIAYDEGLYWVNVLTDCGFYSDSVLLSFYETAYLFLGNDTNICPGEIIELNPGDFNEYLWQDGSEDNLFIVTEPGIYWVKIFDGKCYASDTIFIDECSSLWVPNIFTPNDDNFNDYFYAVGSNITKFKMEIFNRWGRRLQTLNNINEKWDGKYKGNKCSQGVYYWIANFEISDKSGNKINKSLKGSVTLYR